MKRIYVIEDLCNGCRLCQTFCSSLKTGVFNPDDPQAGIRVLKMPGEEQDIPLVLCSGTCKRSIGGDEEPTCVTLCPTGALIYGNLEFVRSRRMELAAAQETHGLFKVLAPWKWPFPWAKPQKDTGKV
jgi:Fe-S-cluster-containing dehydrogenase component